MEPTIEKQSQRGVVFVATDFSAAADEALRQAHALAEARQAKLVACHVVPNLMRVNMLFPQRTVEQSNAQIELQKRVLDLLVERTVKVTGRRAEQFTPVVEEGTPYSAIVDQAERAGADLIVIGDRGEAGVARAVLGSAAERVVRYAHCAVLIARAGGVVRRILVATDLSDPSLPALGAAAREAVLTRAPVTAIYCIEPTAAMVGPQYGLSFAPQVPIALAAEARAGAERRLAEAAREVGLVADLRVIEGAPSAAILEAAKELHVELIVVGTRGRTGLKRVVLGSVAEAVIRGATCSVLAVRLRT